MMPWVTSRSIAAFSRLQRSHVSLLSRELTSIRMETGPLIRGGFWRRKYQPACDFHAAYFGLSIRPRPLLTNRLLVEGLMGNWITVIALFFCWTQRLIAVAAPVPDRQGRSDASSTACRSRH